MRKLPCLCGHRRSDHRHIYYGKMLSVRSPCNTCGRVVEMLPHGGTYSEPKCFMYKSMDNLDYVEWLAKKKHLV